MASRFEIHAIDRDNGDGRYVRRHAFVAPAAETVNHPHPALDGLITHQDLYAGKVATIDAPDGSEVGETASGGLVLVLPGGACLDAGDVLVAAKAARPWHRMGLTLVSEEAGR